MIARCPHCGERLPPKPLVRVCALCNKSIDRHHKYQTVMVLQKPPRFEFHHRHCDAPENYLPEPKKKGRKN